MIKLTEEHKNIIQVRVFKNEGLIDAWDTSNPRWDVIIIMRVIGERYIDKQYKIFIHFISNRNISTSVH